MIDKVCAVQEHDQRIRDIEREMQDIPARKKLEETRLHEHQEEVTTAEEGLKASMAEVKQFELDVESKNEAIQKLRQQQMLLKTNKEFKAMEEEIGAVEAQIRRLEDRELDVMEGVENARTVVAEKKSALGEEEEAVAEDVKLLDSRLADLDGRLAAAKAEREAAAAEVDPEWLAIYERVASRRPDALVKLKDRVCGGCHMTVPPSVKHEAMRRDHIVSCPQCGRLVY